jgi:two-component system, cell cycle sensor histidine kinase and response regulator CckA
VFTTAFWRGGKLVIETSAVHSMKLTFDAIAWCQPAITCCSQFPTQAKASIPQDINNHIFEPFYSTKEEGKGTGLGLSDGVRVKQSGGYIWVYCELKLGTTFKIYLPRLNAKGIPVPPAVLAESVPTGCETILLVEDEAAVRASTREFLQSIGYIVLEARNAQDALELAREYDNPLIC